MTRGHSSKIGVVTAIGLETGKVLDSGTKSKVCKSCDYWEKQDQTSDRNIEAGDFAKTFFAHKDTYRILTSQTRAQLATKESRRRRRLQRLGRDEEGAEREGFPYVAGGY
ncbi:hypothetical protein ACOMHN_023083 [Nucella lapillus]